jgi:fumarate reductase subunit C
MLRPHLKNVRCRALCNSQPVARLPSQLPMKFPSLPIRRPIVREFLIFLGFLALTAIMTWPWVLHLRDAVPDTGDPYATSYFLWWDFHQTFHAPLNLFEATILYPYHYTLAFGEFDYGVSLLFFPLFVLGFRPVTVFSIAAFLSFPFTAYGTFRLARTLSASTAIAWIAGLIIAFLPFRFHHLSHLHLIFAGWIPLLFEALVLFARKRTWPRAAWLGFAFLMNALTCTTWLILTVIPLGISAVLLLTRNNAWRDRNFWLRSAATICLASLLLLPFLLPLRRVAAANGFTRSPNEVQQYSARFINWLAAEERNKVWRGLGRAGVETEMVLFPGLLALLLALAAFLLPPRQTKEQVEEEDVGYKRIVLGLLDSTAIISGIVALLTLGYAVFKLRLFGHVILKATGPARALNALIVTLLVRCLIAYPRVLRRCLGGDKNLSASFNSSGRSELFGHALVWIAIGFAGSFGLNFFFHKFLYDYVYVFRGMRVATRWAMIAYVGLALLAGLGAQRFTDAVGRWWPRFGKAVVYAVIVVAILFELHAAPLAMIRGEINPDALTLDLKNRRMSGGIIELPIGDRDHVYMLRAADHGHPIVNGRYSFVPELQKEIQALTSTGPIPDRVLDIFESIPVSYVTVHYSLLSSEDRVAIDSFLNRGVAMGRLRFIKSFDAGSSAGVRQHNDLYAVTRTEPDAQSAAVK